MTETTPWESGRFDGRAGPREVLFGRMYEDVAIELGSFRPGGRVFCIASAGCTAMRLAEHHPVVAVDINPCQLEYAAGRLAGRPAIRGTAERVMDLARVFGPAVGWSRRELRGFLDLESPTHQVEIWRRLETRRLRAAFDVLFSVSALKSVYASPFLEFLPPRLGAVIRGRLARCFAQHPNKTNPYARALFLGELPAEPALPRRGAVELVHADAAEWLEHAPAASIDGFTLSNILDGAGAGYRARLFAAVRRAAAPGAMVVLRSFADPAEVQLSNRAQDDRAMLWGIVDVRPAVELERPASPN